MDDTPATSTDAALGTEGDSNQIQGEDSMSGGSSDELLDLGTSPPERDTSVHFGETAWEESRGETLDQRVAQEEPEIWEAPEKGATQPDRAGRLAADDGAVEAGGTDMFAVDEGIDGGAASAEEAAVRIVDDPDV
nr:DUF5709 domain-containing protein [uncultured Cellulomonas sp.]